MQLNCEHCGRSFDLPQEKVPAGERLRFACPACGEKNIVNLENAAKKKAEIDPSQEEQMQTSPLSATEDSVEENSIEPDTYPPGSDVAFIHVQDGKWEERVEQILKGYGYYVSKSRDKKEAVQKLSLNRYTYILIEDIPENAALLEEIANWPGETRREINCVLTGQNARSFDPQLALLRGVNSYIYIEERDNIEDLIDKSLQYFNSFFEPWKMAREAGETANGK